MVAITLMLGLLCVKYRRYAYAVAWHCMHGNYAEIGGHRVRLPILWWKENAHAHDTPDLRNRDEWLARACPSSVLPGPEIKVSPTIPGEVEGTEPEELKLTQAVISTLNHNSESGWSHSLLTLTPRPFTLYCIKEHVTGYGLDLGSYLTCHAANLPYSFLYRGPQTSESEAESILSSLE